MPKVKGKRYPTPITTAQPERGEIAETPFGMIWKQVLQLMNDVARVQMLSIVLSRAKE